MLIIKVIAKSIISHSIATKFFAIFQTDFPTIAAIIIIIIKEFRPVIAELRAAIKFTGTLMVPEIEYMVDLRFSFDIKVIRIIDLMFIIIINWTIVAVTRAAKPIELLIKMAIITIIIR